MTIEITGEDDPLFDVLDAARPAQNDLFGRTLRDSVRRRLIGPLDQPFRFGRFIILQRLGSGGMGTVFVAYDPDLDRRIALKVLHTQGERGRAAALREGRALARLRHVNVVAVHEVGVLDDQVFVVMEYIDGSSLDTWARGDRSAEAILARLLEAGRGLAAAHDVGLVHHDFKPTNVVIDEAGHARVIDFGLAREVDDRLTTEDPEGDPSPTTPSIAGGTPAYMAPERLAKRPGDRRSDQFSFCVTAWELLTGERPRGSDAPVDARLPGRIARPLRRGLSAAPDDRFPSMHELLSALTPTAPPWRSPALFAALIVLALSVSLLIHASLDRDDDPRCASPWALLSGTWDPARAVGIGAAMTATGAPFAGETWASLRPRLDRYAESWIAAHARACEETAVLGVAPQELYDRRVVCLEDRRTELAALLDRFAAADREVVARAHEAVDRLVPPEVCDHPDAESLAASADPVALGRRRALREGRARARAELDTGAHEAGLTRVLKLLEDARELDDPALDAELYRLAGSAEIAASRYREAKAHFTAALHRSIAADQAGTAALAVLGLHDARRNLAGEALDEDLLDLAAVYSRRAGDPPRVRLNLLYARATAQMHAERHDEAIRGYDEVRALAIALDERLVAANVLSDRALARESLGDSEGSIADHRRGIAETTALLGPLHPDLARAHNNLAAVLMLVGDRDGVLAEVRASEAIARANFGDRHLLVGTAKVHIGALHLAHGRFDEALQEHRDAAALFIELLGPTHPHVALVECAVAADLEGLRRYEEALAAADRAAALYALHADDRDYNQARCDLIRARILYGLARPVEALAAVDAVFDRVDDLACPPDVKGELRWLIARELWERHGAAERPRVIALLAGTDAITEAETVAERDRLRAALR